MPVQTNRGGKTRGTTEWLMAQAAKVGLGRAQPTTSQTRVETPVEAGPTYGVEQEPLAFDEVVVTPEPEPDTVEVDVPAEEEDEEEDRQRGERKRGKGNKKRNKDRRHYLVGPKIPHLESEDDEGDDFHRARTLTSIGDFPTPVGYLGDGNQDAQTLHFDEPNNSTVVIGVTMAKRGMLMKAEISIDPPGTPEGRRTYYDCDTMFCLGENDRTAIARVEGPFTALRLVSKNGKGFKYQILSIHG